jgi:hypothetical protein
MTDEQYQRLIGVIFLVGAASASPPFNFLFLVIGLVTIATGSLPWFQSYFKSKDAKPDGEEGQKSDTG